MPPPSLGSIHWLGFHRNRQNYQVARSQTAQQKKKVWLSRKKSADFSLRKETVERCPWLWGFLTQRWIFHVIFLPGRDKFLRLVWKSVPSVESISYKKINIKKLWNAETLISASTIPSCLWAALLYSEWRFRLAQPFRLIIKRILFLIVDILFIGKHRLHLKSVVFNL